MRRYICFIILLFASLGSLCAQADDPGFIVKIGVMLEMSGPTASNGKFCSEGLDLALARFAPDNKAGKWLLNIKYADHRGEAKTGVSEFLKMVEIDKVQAVLSTRSQVAMPLNPLSLKAAVPLLAFVGHDDFLASNKYAFRFWPDTFSIAEKTAKSIFTSGAKTLSVITVQEEYSVSLEKNLVDIYQSLGGKVIGRQAVTDTDSDMSPFAARIKKEAAQAVYVNLGSTQLGPFIKKLKEIGYGGAIHTTSWMGLPASRQTVPKAVLEGVRYVELDSQNPIFVEGLSKIHPGSVPISMTYTCYVAMSALISAVKTFDSLPDSRHIYEALIKMKGVDLPEGFVAIEDRAAKFKLQEYTIVNGEVQEY